MAQKRLATRLGSEEVVRIRLLGGFSVSVGERIVEEGGRRKTMSLVKLLALARNHTLHRERVMDLLWPDLDAKHAANNFHRTLHLVRKALAPAEMPLCDELLSLSPNAAMWVDVEVFEDAAAEARRLRNPSAYRTAIELYGGELLPEDLYEEWAEERRNELRNVFLALLVEVAGAYEKRGEYGAGLEALRRAISEEPTNEEAHLALMRLLALRGDRSGALRHYKRLAKTLAREYDVEPGPELRRLHEEIRAGGEARDAKVRDAAQYTVREADSSSINIPAPLTSFVGREREMSEVKRLLSMSGVVTLIGAGGCGKTRLAVEVAREVGGVYPDGAWLVEFAPVSEGAARAVASTLGVVERAGVSLTDTLADYLRRKDILLVLDNCEHLVEEVAQMAEALLGASPRLKILATSREILGVPGEAVWTVHPLSLPDEDGVASTNSGAVRLFVDRARSRLPGFEITASNAAAVARVCRRLDGIPLAIELATARMGAVSVETVAERLEGSLEGSLGMLAGGPRTADPRHKTMRATLEWSHDLLDADERVLFRRLSVFAGGWTLEAAEDVCSGGCVEEEDVLDLISRLVEKSLVVAEGGGVRYRMLEPVRQYGRERLSESEEIEALRERHTGHYLALAERAEPELLASGQAEWFRRLQTEFENLRAALSWSVGEPGRASIRLRLAAALWRFWDIRGFEEGKMWLRAALEGDDGGSPAVRAKVLNGYGFILLFQQDFERAIAALDEAIALYRELGDETGAALALGNLGWASLHGRYRERVPGFLREAGSFVAGGGVEDHVRAYLGIVMGAAEISTGEVEAAIPRLEESLALCRELGDLRNTGMNLFILGMAEVSRDDLDRGVELLEEGARVSLELHDRLGMLYYALAFGVVSVARGNPERAARLWGAAESHREQMGMSLSRYDLEQSGYENALDSVRASLDDAAFDAAWKEGRAMSPEGAVEYALSPPEEAKKPASVLTPREKEICDRVAEGLTNRLIAEELVISKRTVDTHVARILKKLGLRSRAEIPARVESE